MALDVLEIQEKRAEVKAKMQALADLAGEQDRDLSDEEKKLFDQYGEQHKELGVNLERAKRLEQIEAEHADEVIAGRVTRAPDGDGEDGGDGGPKAKPITVPASARRTGKLKAFRGPKAEEDAYLSGQWVMATLFGNPKAQEWCKTNGVVYGALTGADNTLGGALVPQEFETAIIDLREEYGVFRQNADVVPMGTDSMVVPRRTGGVTAYFVADNTEITASDPTWDQVELTARKLGALVKYSSELNSDAVVSIADKLANEIAYAFANKEDSCGFLGTGASTYGGIVGLITKTGSASTVTAATANTAFSTLDLADFESMVGKMPQYPGAQPKWFISKPGWAASMMRLADAAGGNTKGDIAAGVGLSFLGYPVVLSQVMNSTLTAQTSTDGIAYFGDLSLAATLGDRAGVSLMISTDRYFEYDQIGIRGVERFDINCHDCGDSSNAGPIVMLSTPAS